MTSINPVCLGCVHLTGPETCRAFRHAIPGEIFANEVDHRQPYPGDNGIQFEPTEPMAAEYAELVFRQEEDDDDEDDDEDDA